MPQTTCCPNGMPSKLRAWAELVACAETVWVYPLNYDAGVWSSSDPNDFSMKCIGIAPDSSAIWEQKAKIDCDSPDPHISHIPASCASLPFSSTDTFIVKGECCGYPPGNDVLIAINVHEPIPIADAEPIIVYPPCIPTSPEYCCPGGCDADQCSDNPVRYATGELVFTGSDLPSDGFGLPWGHTRTYFHRRSIDETLGQGYSWQVEEWPYLMILSPERILVLNKPGQVEEFIGTGGNYTPRFNLKSRLVLGGQSGGYLYLDPSGVETEFDIDTGMFVLRRDRAGNTIEVLETCQNGYTPALIQRSAVIGGHTIKDSFNYGYDRTSGDYLLASVSLSRQVDSGPVLPVAMANYEYYGPHEAHGAQENLKTVTKWTYGQSGWAEVGKTYYRYEMPSPSSSSSSSSSSGSPYDEPKDSHLLKYVVNPSTYDRMVADSLDPLTASDAVLAQYADYYFEYDGDQRISKEMVQGASRTYLYTYEESSFPDGVNSWKTRTVETLPDGSEKIVYSNYAGRTMLMIVRSGSDEWITFSRYDGDFRKTLEASPSAVTGYNDSVADLLNYDSGTGKYEHLRDNAGKITTWSHDASSGYVTAEWVQEGQLGSAVLLWEREYISCHSGASSSSSSSSSDGGPWFLSRETRYPSDTNQTITEVTTYDYTFHPGTCAVQEKLTTFPLVSVAQNGPEAAATRRDVYDLFGNLTWAMDERGFITRMSYDIPTGAMTQRVDDVDAGLYPDAPAGWSTPLGGGLNLVTDYEHDRQGRITQSLGPAHEVDLDGVATAVRTAAWTVYDDGNHTTYSGQGYATGSSPSYAYTLVNPVSITKTDAGGRVLEQIQATRDSTSGKLIPSDTFAQSSYTRWRTMQYTDCCLVESERVYHTIPTSGEGTEGTNYDETVYGYDVRKRRNRTVTPGGTITRTVIDVRSLVTSVWIGTDDFGGTATDPSGGGAPGNNMKIVTGNVYDGGTDGGDGYLTGQTQYVSDSDTRVTSFTYDYRGRRLTTDGEIDFFQKEYYDNLDRVTKTERYDTTSGGNLIARSETSYDARGRVYEAIRYGVDPSTGTVGNALTDNTWYDASGNVLCSLPAGSFLFAKAEYDSLGRTVKQFTGYNPEADLSDPLGDGSPDGVTNDVILEQSETTYDDASNVIQTTSQQRYHNAPDTQLGELQDPSTTPKARVTYQAIYPDSIGRSQASADYGTNGGTALSRLDTVPEQSDTILVTSPTYDDAGNLATTTDPTGLVTALEYDDAGRRVTVIENFVGSSSSSSSSSSGGGCAPSDDENRTTRFTYTADGQQATLVAVNSATGDQTTTYTYGTTLSDSELATSNLLRSIAYPDSSGGNDVVLFSYNRQGQGLTTTDQRGCVHAYEYDKLGRLTDDRVTTLGTGTDGAVRRLNVTYEVRGLPELLTCVDNPAVNTGTVLNQVKQEYNDFGQIVSSAQQQDGSVTGGSPTVELNYADGLDNTIRPTGVVYPDGRELTYDYGEGGNINDRASRITSIVDDDSTHLADYDYLGLGTAIVVDYTEPDVKYTLVDLAGGNDEDTGDIYSGLDRFGRVKDCRWHNYNNEEDIARLKYGYDRASNRLWREDTVARSLEKEFDELYSYDDLHRLKDMARGWLNGSRTALTSETFGQCWSLDATGNWSGFREDDDGNGAWNLVQARTANPVNEITGITNTVGAAWAQPGYDPAGNITTIPRPADPSQGYTATYDAWNRLVKLTEGSDTVQENEYDARTFRTVRKDYEGGTLSETRHFYYTPDWRCVEERVNSSSDAERQFVWGLRYIDDLVLRDRDAEANGTLGERLYGCQDGNWNVVAVVDDAGDVQERYAYSAYGVPMFLSPAFSLQAPAFGWETLYCGYRNELLTGLYHIRRRIYQPGLGVWVQRDPLGYRGGSNLHEYVSSLPVSLVDPTGLLPPIGISQPIADHGGGGGWGPAAPLGWSGALTLEEFLLLTVGITIAEDTATRGGPKPRPDSSPRPRPEPRGFPEGTDPPPPCRKKCSDREFQGFPRCQKGQEGPYMNDFYFALRVLLKSRGLARKDVDHNRNSALKTHCPKGGNHYTVWKVPVIIKKEIVNSITCCRCCTEGALGAFIDHECHFGDHT